MQMGIKYGATHVYINLSGFVKCSLQNVFISSVLLLSMCKGAVVSDFLVKSLTLGYTLIGQSAKLAEASHLASSSA